MSCRHKKEHAYIKWCDACALVKAGPKPKPEWKYGDIAEYKSFDGGDGPYKVLDSEVSIFGQATDNPTWNEYLIFREGGGSASLYTKLGSTTPKLESAAIAYGNAVNSHKGNFRELLNALAAAATDFAKERS